MALSDNLAAYYSLGEASGNALDAHGSSHLTDNNTVGSTTGKVGNARQFVRANKEYFSLADNAAISLGDVACTWAGWVKFDALANDQLFLCKGSGGSGEYVLEWNVVAALRLRVWGSSGFGSQGTLVFSSAGTISTGVWYFVVWWHDPVANTLSGQVNNGAIDSVSHSAGIFDGTSSFFLGDYPAFTNSLSGSLDEWGLWKRVITSDERTELYNSGNGRDYAYIVGGGGSYIDNTRHYLNCIYAGGL